MGTNDKNERTYDLEERLIAFARRIIDIVEALPSTRAGNHIAGQLIRCGTSPAANYGEAQGAESRRDFVHKLRIVLKELRESRTWLLIIRTKEIICPVKRLGPIITEADELIAIVATSIRTAERGLAKRPGQRKAARAEEDVGGSEG